MHLYGAVKPLLFTLPAETVHGAVCGSLRVAQGTPIQRLLERWYVVRDPRLTVDAFGLSFPTPVGLAAGFDKNGRLPAVLASLGFGHVEIGGITAEPQTGNARPRLFRLPADRALINRMGFNNDGADRVADRLAAMPSLDVPLGINIGKSKTTPLASAADDYRYTYRQLAELGDYFVVNVSSPNTPGLRELQDREPLETILNALRDAGARPLLVKLSPDLAESALAAAVDLGTDVGVDGIIATNTTIARPDTLRSPKRGETGGLSGRPLTDRATAVVRFVADRADCPIIGVGGVFTAADAYEKIRAGASLVQLYTGLVYRGPSIARDINRGLLRLLEQDGFDSITAAVGVDR